MVAWAVFLVVYVEFMACEVICWFFFWCWFIFFGFVAGLRGFCLVFFCIVE